MIKSDLLFNTATEASQVSCFANPFDMRPALDAIMGAIQNRPGDKPLVVVMGEMHYLPMHTALQQGLLARLLHSSSPHSLGLPVGRNGVAFGYEEPHNSLGYMMSLLGNSAVKSLVAFCKDKKITINFNDAACAVLGMRLNQRDPATLKIIQRFAPQAAGSSISAVSPLGMALRNRMIAGHVIGQIEKTGASVYVQHCGMAHVFGLGNTAAPEEHHYKDSLTACFAEAGVDVLAVLLTGSEFSTYDLPEAALPHLHKSVIIRGLSECDFDGTDSAGVKEYLQKISRNSGGEFEPYLKGRLEKARGFIRKLSL